MGLGIYRIKPKLRIAGAYGKAGAGMAAAMIGDEVRAKQVNKVRNAMDAKYLQNQERKQTLKSQEQRHDRNISDGVDEWVVGVGAASRALLKPASKVATKSGGKIARFISKSKTGKKVVSYAQGKGHNVKVARRAANIKAIRYARKNPLKAKAKSVAKTIGGETIVRTAVDTASHAGSLPAKTAVDKAMGTQDSPHSAINQLRSQQTDRAARNMPQARKGPAHTQSNAHMAIRRTEMKPSSLPARQPTRQRTNVSASVIDIAANIFEKYYLDEAVAIVPQFNAANKHIAKPVARAITNPLTSKIRGAKKKFEGVDEIHPGIAADLVLAAHVKPLKKYSKMGARAIVNKGIAPAAEKLADKGMTPGYQPVRKTAARAGRATGRGLASAGRKTMSAGRKTGAFAKQKYGQLRLKVKKQTSQALTHAKKMDTKEDIINEILATTAIGVGAAGVGAAGWAAQRLARRNKINRKIYAKKATKRIKKAEDFEARAKISRAFRSGGRKYTQQRLQAKAGKLRKKIAKFPTNEQAVNEVTARYHARKAARYELSGKKLDLWAKHVDKEGKESSTKWGRGLNKVRGKAFRFMARAQKRQSGRHATALKAKGINKQYRKTRKKYLKSVDEGLLFRSPEGWEKKAMKQRKKAAKAQHTSNVFAGRTRRGLERKAGRMERKAARYAGGSEKFGQSPKKKLTGKSTARIVA